MPRLSQQIALVTGASSGIGAAIAKIFTQEGAQVILSDIEDAKGQALADTLGASYLHLNVAEESDWVAAMAYITEHYGRLDILVNNAGITGLAAPSALHDPEHITLKDWHHVHAVNSDGVMLGCKHAIPQMKTHGGSIINMSSRSGLVGIPAACAYAASKAAVRNHTKSVALYCAQAGYRIRCNSIHPAAVLTELWDDMLGTDPATRQQHIDAISRDIPLGYMGTPEDVAWAAVYLASNESSYVTGVELNVDGGILAGASASPKPED